MIKQVIIGLSSGKTFGCGMEVGNIKKLRELLAKSANLIDISGFLPKEVDDDQQLWINPQYVESIMVQHVSNIAVPSAEIIEPGTKPGA